MIPPYDHEGLWTKATLFINYAYDNERVFSERAFWATLVLELLAKSALSKVNPLLVADPTDDGKSQLIAAGVTQSTTGFKSVAAKTLFARCGKVFPQFNEIEARRLAIQRNDYLHSSLVPFESRAEESWWERFWSLAAVLVTAQDRRLEDLVGFDLLDDVEASLARDRSNTQTRAAALVERARQRLELQKAGNIPLRVQGTLGDVISYSQEYSGSATCPACGESAEVTGEHEIASEIVHDELGDDQVWAMEFVTVEADTFSCRNCRLFLEGSDFIEAAGIDRTFEISREPESDVGEYMNE